MKKEDDALPAESAREVARYADLLLRKASAVGRFPTPVDDLVSAAKLEIARESALERVGLDRVYRRLPTALKLAPDVLKRAASKVIGLLHRPDRVIHLDPSLHPKRRTFVTVHEVGHDVLPHQRSLFKILEDSESELDPDTHELFEREANHFASEVLFQGKLFEREAADSALGIRVAVDLAKKYGPSVYATARRYVTTHRDPCALVVFDPKTHLVTIGEVLPLRRVLTSATFQQQFGELDFPEHWGAGTFFFDHCPRRGFSAPRPLVIVDRNGNRQPCTAEAFNTTHHVLFLLRLQSR